MRTDDLPPALLGAGRSETESTDADAASGSLPEQVAALERRAIEEALALDEGNQSRAARRLGISERALRYKLAKWRQRPSKTGTGFDENVED